MSKDYKVGRGKPPIHTQFKKGQSGNPSGRPKGSRNLSTILVEALTAPTTILDGPDRKRIKVPFATAYVRKLMADCGKGNTTAEKILAQLILHLAGRLPAPDNNDNGGDTHADDPGDEAIIEAALALRHIKGGGGE